MDKIKITLNKKEYQIDKGSNLLALIEKNMPGAKYNFVAGRINGEIIELTTPIENDATVELINTDSEDGLRILRHSTSHVMACAVKKLFPKVRVAIGPAIDDGFYYDFDSPDTFNEEDFEKIEKEMQKIIDENQPFVKTIVSKEEAIKKFEKENEIYKVELINEIKDPTVSYYTNKDFTDLCRGPHVPSTGYIKAFKLMKVAGAYWKGDEKNKMLQRIYGTSFADQKALKAYLNRIKEAMERDHRKIGKEMNLFAFYPEGPGFVFWKPAGMVIYNTVIDYWRKIHIENGYVEVKTPIILNEELWHRSGHWDNYKENMYFTKIDELNYAVKPMNCPGGLLIFQDGIHSYKELPLKIAELGLVHRHEKSGVLHGLFRVRQFTQDDAHVYCTEEQVKDEVKKIIKLIQRIYGDFGFNDVRMELSTKPAKAIGSDEIWAIAEKALAESLNELNLEYKINPGDGAFYGPKIDFHIKDAIGRSWQCGTIQCDFSMPERFDISYVGQDGKKHRPVMLHRAILGSIERFIGIIIEHFKGKFPLWLCPEQVRIIPIAETHNEYAKKIRNILQNSNFRVTIDASNEPLGARIKNARLERVYYIGIIGDNELKNNIITIRKADKDENIQLELNKLTDFLEEKRKKFE
jgi:threonyl-tRNA synthetase